jgi:hypothetical protein
VYVGTLTVSIPAESQPARPSTKPSVPPPKKLKVILSVGDLKPLLLVSQITDEGPQFVDQIGLKATKRGWAEGRIGITFKHAEKGELAFEKNELVGPGGATISKRFCIQILPQNDWDGKSLVGGETHELLYRVFATSDLVQGDYATELPLTVTRHGEVATKMSLPIKVSVNLE